MLELSVCALLIFALPLLNNLHIDLILLSLGHYLAVPPHTAAIFAPLPGAFAFLEFGLDS